MSNTYKFVRNPGEKEKLAPQARLILGHIEAAGHNGISRDDLVAKLNHDVKEGNLVTKQETGKLVGFYQRRMEEAGYITFERAVREKKEKPAKGEKSTVGKVKSQKQTAEAIA